MDGVDERELVASLEKEQKRRLEFLESLRRRFEESLQDKVELQSLCREVDKTEQEKTDFETMVGELQQTRGALEATASREAELFTPQQYQATFERRLFRHLLGLDIKLTENRLISLVFSHLDHSQPDRQFRVALDVTDSGHWEVVSLDPHIHGVDCLQQTLNSKEGSITEFCKAFREQCKKFIES